MENFAPYSLNGDNDGEFIPADLGVGTHTLTLTPYPRPNLNGTPGTATTVTFQVVDNPVTTPVLLTEDNSEFASAINAATFVRGPFSVFTPQPFNPDNRTRVFLFVTDFDSLTSATRSEAVVQVENSTIGIVNLPIEYVGKVPGLDWLTQIEIALPTSLANAGDVWVTVRLHSESTNPAKLRINQTGIAASEPPAMKLFRDPWILPDLRFLLSIPAWWQTS